MNKVILVGRLTRDPEIRYAQGQSSDQLAIARFSIAVDRRFARKNSGADEPTADFFNCTAFGKLAEFTERYLKQGTKIVLVGRIENDNYTNKNGEKVYSVRVVAEELEFAESKAAAAGNNGGGYGQNQGYNNNFQPAGRPAPENASTDGFMNIPEGIEDEGLPFS